MERDGKRLTRALRPSVASCQSSASELPISSANRAARIWRRAKSSDIRVTFSLTFPSRSLTRRNLSRAVSRLSSFSPTAISVNGTKALSAEDRDVVLSAAGGSQTRLCGSVALGEALARDPGALADEFQELGVRDVLVTGYGGFGGLSFSSKIVGGSIGEPAHLIRELLRRGSFNITVGAVLIPIPSLKIG